MRYVCTGQVHGRFLHRMESDNLLEIQGKIDDNNEMCIRAGIPSDSFYIYDRLRGEEWLYAYGEMMPLQLQLVTSASSSSLLIHLEPMSKNGHLVRLQWQDFQVAAGLCKNGRLTMTALSWEHLDRLYPLLQYVAQYGLLMMSKIITLAISQNSPLIALKLLPGSPYHLAGSAIQCA